MNHCSTTPCIFLLFQHHYFRWNLVPPFLLYSFYLRVESLCGNSDLTFYWFFIFADNDHKELLSLLSFLFVRFSFSICFVPTRSHYILFCHHITFACLCHRLPDASLYNINTPFYHRAFLCSYRYLLAATENWIW